MAWTRSCCASLAGLRKRFWQCPQMCTIAADIAGVELAVLDSTSIALLKAMASCKSGPSSNCRGGRCMDTTTTAVSVAASALPALRFARGSSGSASDRLRVCFNCDLVKGSIAVRMYVWDVFTAGPGSVSRSCREITAFLRSVPARFRKIVRRCMAASPSKPRSLSVLTSGAWRKQIGCPKSP